MTAKIYKQVDDIIKNAKRIVIIQADNPDGDSIGTALALEDILHKLGKEPLLYCSVEMPTYLQYLPGWDRVAKELPKQFDASIIVDASSLTLLERLIDGGMKGWLATKPCIVLDHHKQVDNQIDFSNVTINDPSKSSTGELIYSIGKHLKWPIDKDNGLFIMAAILGDTQGLTNKLATAETYRVIAELIELGVDRTALEEKRRELSKMPEKVYRYKATLIERTEFYADGQIAMVSVPQREIHEYSPLYNPAPLIQADMLQIKDVAIAIVFKYYDDGRITAAIRSNPVFGIAGELASRMGGGGHEFASGFKITDGKSLHEVQSECIKIATKLLKQLGQGELST